MQKKRNKIGDPVIAHFSGGRSSAVMVQEMLNRGERIDAVVFSNTGLEIFETLAFAHEFNRNVLYPAGHSLIWLEFYIHPTTKKRTYRQVDYQSADRQGNVFFDFLKSAKYISNRRSRKCTASLKIETTARWAVANNLHPFVSAVGFRSEEKPRIARMHERNDKLEAAQNGSGTRIHTSDTFHRAPLDEYEINKAQVWEIISTWAWTKKLPFDICDESIKLSNCEGCFFASYEEHRNLVIRNPKRAERWAQMEEWGRDYRESRDDLKRRDPPMHRIAWYRKHANGFLSLAEMKKMTFNEHYSWRTLINMNEEGTLPVSNKTSALPQQHSGCMGGYCSTDS